MYTDFFPLLQKKKQKNNNRHVTFPAKKKNGWRREARSVFTRSLPLAGSLIISK
jgi:hypothetical protein